MKGLRFIVRITDIEAIQQYYIRGVKVTGYERGL